ncbi:hypothetical protein JRC04_04980 [Mycolicibacterium sp. S2-37]|uniref:hypothetical protein n=1 Tax=Mycolicibacterium sp. S2-37 TaxID=2810297 RepID=UPI001A940B1A|nr:hypothetical protein [Mycolicibacterium sp. S2-37]MBO0676811.1 hypothetical protein [Mycolicibacterium sp. S2-37]
MTSIYRSQKVWLKDDDGAGNPPFIVTEVEQVGDKLNLTLQQISTETGAAVGIPVECTSNDVLTEPPDTPHTRAQSPIHIEVVHMRDPDGYDEPTFYVNGQPVDELSNVRVTFYSIDCGRGVEFSELVESARYDYNNASPRVWNELAEFYADPAGGKYIDGEPKQWPDDDDDWVSHLDEGEDSPYWATVLG